MSEKKKILLLGGSAQQVPAIKKAKEMGYDTVLIDYLPDNPGQFVADKWYPASTTDVEEVYRIAKEEKVSGILPYASDPAALPAAIVSERLGLPTNPAKSVEILGVKHKFRPFLKENGFACPGHFILPVDLSREEVIEKVSQLKFPVVIKPTDSSGSKGVSFINDIAEIDKALEWAKSYSRNGVLIAEEFIHRGHPHIIAGDIFVVDGKITIFGDLESWRDNGGESLIPIGEKYPEQLTETQRDNMYSELQRLMDVLEIRNGEFNIEILIDNEDRPHFLEVGPRAGGNMIPVQVSDIYGVDLIEANVAAAMGEKIELSPVTPSERFMTLVVHSHKPGIFERLDFSDEVKDKVYRTVYYKHPGDKIEAFNEAGKAIGIVFMKFDTEKEMRDVERNVDQYIKVVLK